MTPDEFAKRMRQICPPVGESYYPEDGHREADALLCEVLRSLGYEEGVAIFEAAERWYT